MDTEGGPGAARPSVTDINKMKLAFLKETLKSAVSELQAYDDLNAEFESTKTSAADEEGDILTGGVSGILRLILIELRAMRAERAIKQLRQDFNTLQGVITHQERFLERLDARDREKNFVITGLPEETEFGGASTDLGKCKKVCEIIGANVEMDVVRIGKAVPGRHRPILGRVKNRETRDAVLTNTKVLKEAGPLYKNIYVKKDVYPAVRREWKRLNDAEITEKNKPANQGCNVYLDFKKRVLLRDDVIIDRVYFQ